MQKLIRLTTCFLLLVAIFVMGCGGKAVPLTKAEEESDAKKVGRIFEMRTYHCNDGKLDELQARFRNHTNKLFAKHGMEVVGYWVSIDEKDTFFTFWLSLIKKLVTKAGRRSWVIPTGRRHMLIRLSTAI